MDEFQNFPELIGNGNNDKSDAAIIAQRCDGTVLITESGANGRKAVQKAKEQLEQTGTPFLGVVLNKFNIKAAEYGSYGGYGSYGEYGKK